MMSNPYIEQNVQVLSIRVFWIETQILPNLNKNGDHIHTQKLQDLGADT